jgi:hypothetical protein
LPPIPTTVSTKMAKRTKGDGNPDAGRAKGVERQHGVNVLTNTDFGVYVEGAEQTIEMYERGELSREDLDVVYRSKPVESKEEEQNRPHVRGE